MCMLCVVPPGVMPDKEKLEASALNNPHGFGFSIVIPEENRILRERTMDADESIARFIKMKKKYTTGWSMWHARYATHGSRNVVNCHPFLVGNDEKTHLGHNGVLDIKIPAKDDRSDTRVFADDLLPAIGGVAALDNPLIWDMLEDYTSGSKICVLTVDPVAQYQMYVLNAHLGTEDKHGVWWSNNSCYLTPMSSYKPKPRSMVTGGWVADKELDFFPTDKKGKPLAKNKNGLVECPNCAAESDEESMLELENTCHWCMYCFDCKSQYVDCNCYYGGTHMKKSDVVSESWGLE